METIYLLNVIIYIYDKLANWNKLNVRMLEFLISKNNYFYIMV